MTFTAFLLRKKLNPTPKVVQRSQRKYNRRAQAGVRLPTKTNLFGASDKSVQARESLAQPRYWPLGSFSCLNTQQTAIPLILIAEASTVSDRDVTSTAPIQAAC